MDRRQELPALGGARRCVVVALCNRSFVYKGKHFLQIVKKCSNAQKSLEEEKVLPGPGPGSGPLLGSVTIGRIIPLLCD